MSMNKLLVLAPVSEYRGDRVDRVVRVIQRKNPELEIVTSRQIWHNLMPQKPAYVSHSQWKAQGTGFYTAWVASYRRELGRYADVLVIPRADGSIGNGTRVDLKHVPNARKNILLDDRLVPFTKVDAKGNREDKVRNVVYTRTPELSRV
jgi:hypothetical protein